MSQPVLVYTTQGAQLITVLTLNRGTYDAVVEEWGKCGGAAVAPITITVGSSSDDHHRDSPP